MDDDTTTTEPVSAEQAKGDVQEQVDAETDKGFVGVEVDQTPNEEYTLTTGPDSPSHVENDTTRTSQASAGATKE